MARRGKRKKFPSFLNEGAGRVGEMIVWKKMPETETRGFR